MSDTLFDGPEPLIPPTEGEKRRRRDQVRIDAGLHPLSALPLASNGETCRSCVHRIHVGGHAKAYPKCEVVGITNGPGTDCKAGWPACVQWQRRPL